MKLDSLKHEMQPSKCRWMLFTNDNKLIIENHSHGITWKKVYKEEFGNLKALCFQLIPNSKKVFVKESPFNEFWTFEEFELIAGQSIPTHLSRNLCSLQKIEDKNGLKLGIWEVLTIDMFGNTKKSIMDDTQIGYEVRNFINKDETTRIMRGI